MQDGRALLQHTLQISFDIPFVVESGIANGDPWYKIRPMGHTNELFDIQLAFQNQIRLNMDFFPGSYSAPLIRDMSSASPDQRAAFMGYAKIMLERRARINFEINNMESSSVDDSEWPQNWNNIKLKITKSPVTEENESFEPEKIIVDWGCLFTGMILSLLEVVPINGDLGYIEGATEGGFYRVPVNKYERSAVNRNLCIAAKGCICSVCGMNFQAKYGEIGIGYIHVHHIVPVSKMGPNYAVNPMSDLTPVCPNCHAMLHKKDPPLDVEELRKIISDITN